MTNCYILASKRASRSLAEKDYAKLKDHGLITTLVPDEDDLYEIRVTVGTKNDNYDDLLEDIKVIGFTDAKIVEC